VTVGALVVPMVALKVFWLVVVKDVMLAGVMVDQWVVQMVV